VTAPAVHRSHGDGDVFLTVLDVAKLTPGP